MNRIIRNLWLGNICEMEHCGNTPEICRAEERIADERELLSEGMTVEQRRLLETYTDRLYSIGSELAEEAFVRGVRLGIRLASEVWAGK